MNKKGKPLIKEKVIDFINARLLPMFPHTVQLLKLNQLATPVL